MYPSELYVSKDFRREVPIRTSDASSEDHLKELPLSAQAALGLQSEKVTRRPSRAPPGAPEDWSSRSFLGGFWRICSCPTLVLHGKLAGDSFSFLAGVVPFGSETWQWNMPALDVISRWVILPQESLAVDRRNA